MYIGVVKIVAVKWIARRAGKPPQNRNLRPYTVVPGTSLGRGMFKIGKELKLTINMVVNRAQ